MLRIAGLTRRYGELIAVRELDLEVGPGEIHALLGPNGAGKTTTLHCIVGLLRPDAGTITVAGHDVVADPMPARRALAYVPEVANLYEALTPAEFLQLKGRLFGLDEGTIGERATRLLAGFELDRRAHDPMFAFSKGMLQKVSLSAALLTEPRLLVLDEPHSGLDASTALVLKELLREFARRGGAVLLCSHVLDLVETIADRITVLDRGAAIATGTLGELRGAPRAGAERRLEELFRELTAAADPVARAREILG
jgi:ABC-2 type transport system ATP-binding protein